MVEFFVERDFDPPLTIDEVFAAAASAQGCFGLYKIHWLESLLALDGATLICRFAAPDAESLRSAFRITDGCVPTLWPGTVHPATPTLSANVAVERRFEEPADLDAISALEKKNAWCLEARHVSFERTFFSQDRKRMICLYQAPDVEAVRQAQRQAGMPVERVWSFQRLSG